MMIRMHMPVPASRRVAARAIPSATSGPSSVPPAARLIRGSRGLSTRVFNMAEDDEAHLQFSSDEESDYEHAGPPARGQSVRLFLDTASEAAMTKWLKTGIFYGVTCNPTILKRDGMKNSKKSLIKLTSLAFEHGCEEMHMQAWGSSSGALSSCALDLANIDPARVVVKLPCTVEGMQAASMLCQNRARVNLTGLYASHQVLIAQALGASYAAPYLGRMKESMGGDQGIGSVSEMLHMIKATDSDLRLMIASVKDVKDMAKLAAQGCDTFTISPEMAEQLFNVPDTLKAVAEFEADAQSNLE